MLEKMGWKRGDGLGKQGKGMKDPVRLFEKSKGGSFSNERVIFFFYCASRRKLVHFLFLFVFFPILFRHTRSSSRSGNQSRVSEPVPSFPRKTPHSSPHPGPAVTGRKPARGSLTPANRRRRWPRRGPPKPGSKQKTQPPRTHNLKTAPQRRGADKL